MSTVRFAFVLAFVAQFVFIAASGATTKKKEMAEYWKETGMNFRQAEAMLNDQNCHKTRETFLGCVFALNTVLTRSEPQLALVTTEQFKKSKSYGAIRLELGVAKVVELGKDVDPAEAEKDARDLKTRLLELRQDWLVLFKGNGRPALAFNRVRDLAKTSAVTPANEAAVAAEAINRFLSVAVDAHTYLIPRAYIEDENQSEGETFFGIGTMIRQNKDGTYTLEPIDGGPAVRAGLKQRDVLLAVDGVDAKALPLDQLVEKIRGPEGTKVELRIKRKGDTLTVTVPRGQVRIENVEARLLLSSGVPMGYIRLRSFMEDASCKRIRGATAELETRGARALVFDLRGNGGGQLELARCIAGVFLPAYKPVVIERPVSGPAFMEKVLETYEGAATTLPMVTLIDAGSASASEIVAGALQDHARSFIVGERSYGKGTVQGLFPLKYNSRIIKAETVARFYLPSGRTNQIEGILPDITAYRVPNPTEDDKLAYREEDLYPNALPAVGTPWTQPRPQVIAKLDRCLAKGQASQRFEAAKDDAVAPDYQLIVGEETLKCALSGM